MLLCEIDVREPEHGYVSRPGSKDSAKTSGSILFRARRRIRISISCALVRDDG